MPLSVTVPLVEVIPLAVDSAIPGLVPEPPVTEPVTVMFPLVVEIVPALK